MNYMSAVFRRKVAMSSLMLFVLLVGLVGCQRNEAEGNGAIGALRKEIGSLKTEVRQLRAHLERRGAMDGHVRRRMPLGRAAETNAVAGVKAPPGRPVGMSPEEMKARHEAMRDPKMREKMRAEHRARMEEHRKRAEERRARVNLKSDSGK